MIFKKLTYSLFWFRHTNISLVPTAHTAFWRPQYTPEAEAQTCILCAPKHIDVFPHYLGTINGSWPHNRAEKNASTMQ